MYIVTVSFANIIYYLISFFLPQIMKTYHIKISLEIITAHVYYNYIYKRASNIAHNLVAVIKILHKNPSHSSSNALYFSPVYI